MQPYAVSIFITHGCKTLCHSSAPKAKGWEILAVAVAVAVAGCTRTPSRLTRRPFWKRGWPIAKQPSLPAMQRFSIFTAQPYSFLSFSFHQFPFLSLRRSTYIPLTRLRIAGSVLCPSLAESRYLAVEQPNTPNIGEFTTSSDVD